MYQRFLKDLGLATVVSFVMVLPFAILDLRANGIHGENGRDFIMLFGLMWLLPMVFIVILLPVARTLRTRNLKLSAVKVIFGMLSMAVIAVAWCSLLLDQLPCFLGVPNCD